MRLDLKASPSVAGFIFSHSLVHIVSNMVAKSSDSISPWLNNLDGKRTASRRLLTGLAQGPPLEVIRWEWQVWTGAYVHVSGWE